MALFNREGGPRQDNQPLRGRVDLGVSAPPRPDGRVVAPDRTAPPPPIQPRPDRRQQPTPEQRPEEPNHTARNIALAGTGLLGLGGLAAWTAYETIPAFHQMVDQAFLSHLRGDQLVSTDTKPETVFDNNSAEEIEIGKNIHFISTEEARQSSLKPVVDKEAETITFTLPFKLPENTTGTIERMTVEKLDPNVLRLYPDYKPTIIPIYIKFNKIVTIVAPEDAHMHLMRGNQELLGQNPNFPAYVRFFKYYPEEDATVVWWIVDGSPTRTDGHFVTSLPMRDFKKGDWTGTNWENLPKVDALTEVMTTTEPNQPLHLNVMTYKGKTVGPDAEIAKQDFLMEPKFHTTETGKLIAIANGN